MLVPGVVEAEPAGVLVAERGPVHRPVPPLGQVCRRLAGIGRVADDLLDGRRSGGPGGLPQLLEDTRGERPHLRVLAHRHRDELAVERDGQVGEPARIRVVVVAQRHDRGRHLRGGAAQAVLVVALRHPGRHPPGVPFAGRGPLILEGDHVEVRDGDTVQEHPADPLREQVSVDDTEPGAPGDTEEAELAVTEPGPDPVHVAGHVRGGEPAQERRIRVAAVGQGLGLRRETLPSRRLGDRAGRLRFLPRRRRAVPLGAVTDAPRVESDQVVPVVQVGGTALGQQLHRQEIAAAARAARIQRQAAQPVLPVGGLDPGERDGDRPALRPAVVQGNADRAALLPGQHLPEQFQPVGRDHRGEGLVGIGAARLPGDR
ncbi:hypothetical protein Acsp01_71160 [Actinoplanes sp. NBRC 101535]|nr:hypothetical protein Acsp01_71160 [Actinoplanes sp. NBRC 101535]